MLCTARNQIRRFCQLADDEALAIKHLIEKAQNSRDELSNWKKVLADRKWASAPIVEVSGRLPVASWKRPKKSIAAKRLSEDVLLDNSVVKIRWNDFEDRDLNIVLNQDGDYETMYSAEVKAILYGIVTALHWNGTYIRMKSTNEIVVRVAQGIYQAKQEIARFTLIKKYIYNSANKKKNGLLVKLDKSDPADQRIVRNIDVPTINESDFFKTYKDSIERLKSDV